MQNKISLFIPFYNCRDLIKLNIEKSCKALSDAGFAFELFIVDDNSSDRSCELAAEIERMPRNTERCVKYLFYSEGPSRRENLAKSFFLAGGDIICFIDADFSCDVSFLVKAIKTLKEHRVDMVIGSRYVKGAKAKRRLVRRVLSFFYNLAIRLLLGSGIKDHQCGLKAFKKAELMPVIEKMGYDEKFIRGWFWDAELLVRAQRAGLSIIEMPVDWRYADISTFNLRKELKCLKAIVKFKMGLR
ncbi:MAG: glycosyltransferase [Candidatus Omnitrophica bacterium]|nr:glycosyltransferase [Candidatus Omnitrophota bacterium]